MKRTVVGVVIVGTSSAAHLGAWSIEMAKSMFYASIH